MVEKSQTETVDVKALPIQKASNIPTIYCNNSIVGVSSFDFQLRLTQLTFSEGKPVMQEVATIFMPPGQAKAMALQLLRSVTEYEADHGISIPVPDHLKKAAEITKLIKK